MSENEKGFSPEQEKENTEVDYSNEVLTVDGQGNTEILSEEELIDKMKEHAETESWREQK